MKTILFTIYSFLAIATTLSAQQLEMVWKAPAGDNVVMSGGTTMFTGSMDANGDGRNDLITRGEDDPPSYYTILLEKIFDSGEEQQIDVPVPTGLTDQIDDIIALGFLDFFSNGVDAATGVKPLLLANRKQQLITGILEEGSVEYQSGIVAFNKKYRLANVKDYDGDGFHEILLYNRDTQELELFTRGSWAE